MPVTQPKGTDIGDGTIKHVDVDFSGAPNKPTVQQTDSLYLGEVASPSTLKKATIANIKAAMGIPAAQVNSDWNAASGVAQILNKPASFTPAAHTHVHNDTTSKQGGKAPDEYYHLGEEQHKKLIGIADSTNIFIDVKHGYLYNHYAAYDSRNMAPLGFRVPTEEDWDALITYCGGDSVAAGPLKEEGTAYWIAPNTEATNLYGFNLRGSGSRGTGGTFSGLNGSAAQWSKTKNSLTGVGYEFQSNSTIVTKNRWFSRFGGMSVHLIKEDSNDTGSVTGNDGKIYPTIKIGNQVWTSCNLCETKYRNGDSISGPNFTDNAWENLTTEAYCIYNGDVSESYNGYMFVNQLTNEEAEWIADANAIGNLVDYFETKLI